MYVLTWNTASVNRGLFPTVGAIMGAGVELQRHPRGGASDLALGCCP